MDSSQFILGEAPVSTQLFADKGTTQIRPFWTKSRVKKSELSQNGDYSFMPKIRSLDTLPNPCIIDVMSNIQTENTHTHTHKQHTHIHICVYVYKYVHISLSCSNLLSMCLSYLIIRNHNYLKDQLFVNLKRN